MLNETTINAYCKECGYTYRLFGDIAIITTSVDEWKLKSVQFIEDGKPIDKILVEHINKAGNRTGKMQFHSQRYAYDLDYIFTNIITAHESYNRVYEKAFRLKELFAII